MKSHYYYWGPLLWHTKISNDIVDGLLERGLKSKTPYNHELVGYFDDEYLYSEEDLDWFVDKMNPYFAEHKNVYENIWYMDKMKPLQLKSMWINIMRAGDFNPPHIHDGEFSFVIYLKIPEKLREEFDSYKGASKESNGAGMISFGIDTDINKRDFITERTFFPEVGDMFIFPAKLMHYVTPFKCAGERISVSGNLLLR